jgi:L-cysteate sulfo-lyase
MAVTPMSGELAGFSRVRLGLFPSPLAALPRLGAAVGGTQLWGKRGDSVGPAMGGNKTRKLEYLFGQARVERA